MFESEATVSVKKGSVPDEIWQDWVQCAKILRGRAMFLTKGNVEEAEDILSSTIIRTANHVLLHRTVVREPRSFFLCALNNEFISRCRKHAHERRLRDFHADVYSDLLAPEDGLGIVGVEDTRSNRDTLALLERVVARLPSDGRLLFRLRFREERSSVEIASLLKISPALVRKRVQLLRQKLRGAVAVLE
ncbi:sigma-70 family RNA polymerase sigma factor [Xanthomonas sp. GPE 39]|uniref:RNA polymerase sigma factor n=1 Tax=Xanthomonas sp. GPE 39 TaxID=1583099 RepID=UPI0005F2CDE1|nr:sigma-70 family RNA polymerase sigma factor [Xanthomonas sp. GPE 39]